MLRFTMPANASTRGATSCQACACTTAYNYTPIALHRHHTLLDVSMHLTAGSLHVLAGLS